MFIDFRDKAKEREKNTDVRENIDWLTLGIEPAKFWCTDDAPTNRATQAGPILMILKCAVQWHKRMYNVVQPSPLSSSRNFYHLKRKSLIR